MRYLVPVAFDLQVFLDACLLAGVALFVDASHPVPDGAIMLKEGELEVTLNPQDAGKASVVDAAVAAQGGTPV